MWMLLDRCVYCKCEKNKQSAVNINQHERAWGGTMEYATAGKDLI